MNTSAEHVREFFERHKRDVQERLERFNRHPGLRMIDGQTEVTEEHKAWLAQQIDTYERAIEFINRHRQA